MKKKWLAVALAGALLAAALLSGCSSVETVKRLRFGAVSYTHLDVYKRQVYGFVSGGDPASIPALTYEKYKRVYHRHYSADNCCITLYGKMDMACLLYTSRCV